MNYSSKIMVEEVISAPATFLSNMFATNYKIDDRQLTPDSEALVSSDDETDRHEQTRHAQKQRESTLSAYRLTESASTDSKGRKASFASSSMLPTNSQPNTQSSVPTIWTQQYSNNNNIGHGHTASSNFNWGGAIWNNDPRKEPLRLIEVLSSPKIRSPPLPSASVIYGDCCTHKKNQSTNSTIPFAIPLYPTPKTYRSQSYSVGQQDLESPPSTLSHAISALGGRGRTNIHSNLHHRPSRPSMLSEIPIENILGKVKEVDDYDEESIKTNLHERAVQPTEVDTPELPCENTMVYQQKRRASRSRPGSSTGHGFPHSSYGTLPKDLESAIEEVDDVNDDQYGGTLQAKLGRRQSNLSAAKYLSSNINLSESGKLENAKKAIWQSSLDFGGLSDTSQSRRHSFAFVPTSHNPIDSVIELNKTKEIIFQEKALAEEYPSKYADQKRYPLNDLTGLHFGGVSTLSHKLGSHNPPAYQIPARPCANQTLHSIGRSTSPQNIPYCSAHCWQSQSLNIVLFKCARSDIFYVQEGTGLTVKPGDMVIVEADRGTDLGTVARVNIDWATAKDLKEYYSDEHFKWLTTLSQATFRTRDNSNANQLASSNSLLGSSLGGIGSPSQHVLQDSNLHEIKPKIIKRLAQKHEIQALREKEGSEAKAKRVCMQKVKEHGLQMEILDAEFQMDWKKLTFYYFADTYINFNSLVTDLFKLYKTRIWMSAINPASFATSPLSLQGPSNFRPSTALRHFNTQMERSFLVSDQPKSTCALQAKRGYQNPFPHQMATYADCPFNSIINPRCTLGISPFTNTSLPNTTTSPNIFASPDYFIGLTPQSGFRRHPSRLPQNFVIPLDKDRTFRRESLSDQNEILINNFQGLSMNSR